MGGIEGGWLGGGGVAGRDLGEIGRDMGEIGDGGAPWRSSSFPQPCHSVAEGKRLTASRSTSRAASAPPCLASNLARAECKGP